MKILITGAGGLLGSAIADAARNRGHDVVAGVRPEGTPTSVPEQSVDLDVTDPETVRHVVGDLAPDALVHCAAYTDVDGAEADPDAARAVNADGTRIVALAAAKCGSLFVYPSSDYVFDGQNERPYTPDDPLRPINAYGRSKVAGEDAVRNVSDRWLIIRTSWLYGAGAPNFVTRILEEAWTSDSVEVVDDQIGRPTWTFNLSGALVQLLEMEIDGRVIHLADGGRASWYDLAREACRLEGITTPLVPVSTEEWNAPAPRPPFSVLDLTRAEKCLNRPMPDWRDSLRRFLEGGR